jgi:hypothetical protein
MRNNPRMTPQRWKGAGIVLLTITLLLVIGALVSVYRPTLPVAYGTSQLQFVPASLYGLGLGSGLLRGVVLGCFAGVAFFAGMACFLWSGVAEAKQQRAEILLELTALRTRIDKTP